MYQNHHVKQDNNHVKSRKVKVAEEKSSSTSILQLHKSIGNKALIQLLKNNDNSQDSNIKESTIQRGVRDFTLGDFIVDSPPKKQRNKPRISKKKQKKLERDNKKEKALIEAAKKAYPTEFYSLPKFSEDYKMLREITIFQGEDKEVRNQRI